MNLTRGLYNVARWCVSHGWVVVALWIAFLGGVNLLDRTLPPPAIGIGDHAAPSKWRTSPSCPPTHTSSGPLPQIARRKLL